jgi:TonB family protein
MCGEKLLCALEVVVAADGVPKIIAVAGKMGPFNDAALAAGKGSQFAPGTLNGKPVPTRLFVWVPFMGADREAIPVIGQLNKVPGVIGPKALNMVEAEFSDEARRKQISGTVLVAIVVTEDGKPADARVLVPLGAGLDEQALKSVMKYKFSPAKFEGGSCGGSDHDGRALRVLSTIVSGSTARSRHFRIPYPQI